MIAPLRRRLVCANPTFDEVLREALVWRYAARPRRPVTRLDTRRTGGRR